MTETLPTPTQTSHAPHRDTEAGARLSAAWCAGGLALLALTATVLHRTMATAASGTTPLMIGAAFGALQALYALRKRLELGITSTGAVLGGVALLFVSVSRGVIAGSLFSAIAGWAVAFALLPLLLWLGRLTLQGKAGAVVSALLLTPAAAWAGMQLPVFPFVMPFVLGVALIAGGVQMTNAAPFIGLRFPLLCILLAMFRMKVEGEENVPETGGALIVSNHVSYADVVILGYFISRPIRFLMFQPLFEIPVANKFFRMLEAIPVDQVSPKNTLRALKQAHEQVAAGGLVGIFPEGSITRSGEIEPFTRGFERIVNHTDAPIIPVHIGGVWGHPLSCKGGALMKCFEKAFLPLVTVRVGKPIHGRVTADELRDAVVALSQ